MFKRVWAVAVTALLLTMGITSSAEACPGHHARPFHATATGTVSYDFSNPRMCPDPGFPFTTQVAAQGRARHLGTMTVAATHCESANRSTDGLMVLTAPNGDAMTGTYATEWVVSDNQVIITGWLRVTGGTGRFEHATGRVWQHHVITLGEGYSWPVAMTFNGVIRT